jgi:cation transport ATPase
MSEQEAIARAREREAEIVRIRAAKKLQAALRNKKIGQNYQNQLNLNKANAEAAAQQEEMARQAAKENSNQQNQEYIKSRQNEYRRIKAANTLSNAWLNRQAIHQFADEYANREQEKRQAALLGVISIISSISAVEPIIETTKQVREYTGLESTLFYFILSVVAIVLAVPILSYLFPHYAKKFWKRLNAYFTND